MQNDQPFVTVIMPVLNEADFIHQSLAAILAQDYPAGRLEILVVDGGSTDDTRQIAADLLAGHPCGRLLDNPKQIQAAGLNVGILAARGEIIVRVDGHTLIEPDYVSACVRCLQQGQADNVGGMMRPVGTTFVGQAVALATTSPFAIGGSKFHYSDQEQYVDTVYLGAFWRKTFYQIGLYDETFRINEDYELNYRLRQAGGRILLTSAIKSTYIPRASLSALWQQYFRYGCWKVQTLRKHPASLRWRQTVPPLFVGLLFCLLLAGFLAPQVFLLGAAVAGCYLLANLVASTISAVRGGWQYFPIVPVVFTSIHFAWGLGFWYGALVAPFGHQSTGRKRNQSPLAMGNFGSNPMNDELLLKTYVTPPHRYSLSIQMAEHRTILMIVDGILVTVALLIGLWLGARQSNWVFSLALIWAYLPWFIGVTVLYFVLATANDAYRPRIALDPAASLIALIKTVFQILALYLLIYALLPPWSLPRHFVGYFALISPFLLIIWRRLYTLIFAMAAFQRRAIVVGAGWPGRTIAKSLADFAPLHYEVIGFVDDDPANHQKTIEGVPVLGPTSELVTLAQKAAVTDVVLALNQDLHGELLASLLTCYEQGVQVSTMSEVYERLSDRVPVEHIGDNWFVVLPLENRSQNLAYRLIKRILDLLASLLGLLFLGVMLPVLALLIRLDSPGPVFYRQKRVGRAGKEFELLKLRSMFDDAEQDGQARWAERYDKRVTRVGQLLRRTRLDELPQLVNVLRGEMSLVGPRPERPEFVAQLQQEIPFYRTRLTVKPGLTGWAQVNYDYGRSVTDALEKLRYDLYYIKHQSLQLDLVILLKTVSTILLLKGV